jgi:hypothetical protein
MAATMRRNPLYTSSIKTRRPTMAAARCRLERVMSFLASSSRSTCVRLVFSSPAIFFFDIFFFFMAFASCHATTSLIACAWASSKNPLAFQKIVDARTDVSLAHWSNSVFAPSRQRTCWGVRTNRLNSMKSLFTLLDRS